MTTDIREYSKTEQALAILRDKYAGAIYDVETTEGMAEAKAARSDVRGYRTSLEAKRKEIKAPALERCRMIDSEARRITAELVAIEGPIADQIKAIEAKRVQDIQDRIANLRGVVDVVNSMGLLSAAELTEFITDIVAITIDDSFDEFRDQAEDAKVATLARLKEMRGVAEKREAEAAAEQERIAAQQKANEAEAARLKKLADEQAERDRLAREEQERIAAEQKAAADKLAQERHEFDVRQQAEKQAREDAERAKELAEMTAKAEREAAERIERLRPDAEKLAKLADDINAIAMPDVSTSDALMLVARVHTAMAGIANDLRDDIAAMTKQQAA